MKKIEREELNVEELERIGEFAYFTTEEFRCKEELNDTKEEFDVKEIQEQSFVDQEIHSNKNNKSHFEKINSHIQSSLASGTAAASTSISIVAVIGVVATGVVPILGEDFGHIDFINYRIDYSIDENDEINKNITIFFEDEVKDGFKVEVKNLTDSTVKELDLSYDYVTFESLNDNFYNFEVSVIDKDLKTLDSYVIEVNTITDYSIAIEIPFEYTLTYNEDDTTNLYVKLKYEGEYKNVEFSNSLNILDASNNILDYEFMEKEGVLFVENIKEKNFDFETRSYYLKDGNEYLINSMIQRNLLGDGFSYLVEAELDNLKLSIHQPVVSDIELNVKYLDYDEEEKFVIPKDEINNASYLDIKLSRICEELEISLNGTYQLSETIEGFEDYKGSKVKKFSYTSIVNPKVYNTLDVVRCEILSAYGGPVRLYFNGYMEEGSKMSIRVWDSLSNEIDSVTNLYNIPTYVEFFDLDDTQVLKFEYMIYDEQGAISFSGYYITQVNVPEEYLNLDTSLNYINPSDVFVTFNANKTYNAYFAMNLVNNSEFDVEYKISLLDDDELKYEYIGSDNISAIYYISSDRFYSINYCRFVHDGLKYYAISDVINVSGGLDEIEFSEEGYVMADSYIKSTLYQEPNVYKVEVNANEIGDLSLNVKFDNNEEIDFVIPESEVTYETLSFVFYLDLSEYTFTNADVTILALGNSHYGLGDYVKKNMEIVGEEYILNYFTFTI